LLFLFNPAVRSLRSVQQASLLKNAQFKLGCRRHVCLGKKKGGDGVGTTKRGKGSKLMLLVDGTGPPGPSTSIGRKPVEVTLIEPLPDSAVTPYVAGSRRR
jgi:hypothetical protein